MPGVLLKLLAETMAEKHSRSGDSDHERWRGAEYLADQIGTHAAALVDVLEDLERLGMSVERASPPPPVGPGGWPSHHQRDEGSVLTAAYSMTTLAPASAGVFFAQVAAA